MVSRVHWCQDNVTWDATGSGCCKTTFRRRCGGPFCVAHVLFHTSGRSAASQTSRTQHNLSKAAPQKNWEQPVPKKPQVKAQSHPWTPKFRESCLQIRPRRHVPRHDGSSEKAEAKAQERPVSERIQSTKSFVERKQKWVDKAKETVVRAREAFSVAVDVAEFKGMQDTIVRLQGELATLRSVDSVDPTVDDDESLVADLPHKKSRVGPTTFLGINGCSEDPIGNHGGTRTRFQRVASDVRQMSSRCGLRGIRGEASNPGPLHSLQADSAGHERDSSPDSPQSTRLPTERDVMRHVAQFDLARFDSSCDENVPFETNVASTARSERFRDRISRFRANLPTIETWRPLSRFSVLERTCGTRQSQPKSRDRF